MSVGGRWSNSIFMETITIVVSAYLKNTAETRRTLAEKLGMSVSSLSNRLNGNTAWQYSDIDRLINLGIYTPHHFTLATKIIKRQ